MSNQDVSSRESGSLDVVRLKVDGAGSAVNTLRDQQTARGVSLICPFPALEVEIPVSFAEAGGEPGRRGTIHRIGVEDDPESGLPRLRLSLRAHETRATVVSAPSQSLLDETSRLTRTPDASANTDLDLLSEVDIDLGEDDSDTISDLPSETPIDLFEQHTARPTPPPLPVPSVPDGSDDPAWVDCHELPLPDQLADRARTRRKGRISAAAAWIVVLALAAGGVYVLDRAEVVSIDSIREHIAGFNLQAEAAEPVADDLATPAPSVAEIQAADQEQAEPEIQAVEEQQEAVSSYSGFAPEESPEEMLAAVEEVAKQLDALDDEAEEIPSESSMDLALENVAAVQPAPAQEVEEAPVEEPAPMNENEVSVVLPTRWPAQYANAYRLRDPNGVVVDIPGGLIKREGWLEIGKDHPMIRSIKAVQRETGARYVIFVNGSLPRFMTAPKTGGIMLRLYRETPQKPGETEQVAMLEK